MNKLSLGLSIVAFAAICASIYFFEQLQDERARNETLNARLSAGMHGREVAADYAPTMQPEVMHTAAPPSPARAASPDDRPIEAPPGNGFSPRLGGPPFRTMSKQEGKLRLMRAYPDLASALHLSPAEVDKLFDVLADYQLKQQQQLEALHDKNLSPEESANEQRRQSTEAKRERDQQIAATLGSDKTKQWQDYENSLGARTQIRELGTILESSGYPLREDQVQTLVDALAPEQNRFRAEWQADPAMRVNFRDMDQTQ